MPAVSGDPMKATLRTKTRLTFAVYLASAVLAGFSIYVLQKLVVRGDPVATAANILGSESLFRLGFAADLAGIMLFVAAVFCLYELLKPAGRSLALLMMCFCLLGSGIQALNSLQDLTALIFLKAGNTLAALTTAQSQALAFVFIRMHSFTYNLALAFFGVCGILIAALVLRSTFLPRATGIMMVVAGLGYLTFSFSLLLAPAFAARVYPFVPMGTAAIGEGSLMLWLLVKGVDAQRWEEQAAAAGQIHT
jgi:hypothetical protein